MMIPIVICKVKIIVTLSLIAVMLLCFQLHASPFTLKSLKTDQAEIEKSDNGLATVAMIYQPDCSWCKKQGKILAQLFEACQSSLNIAIVGTKGSSRQLKKELKHYHADIPAFKADRRFLRLIGGYQASPTTVIFNKSGNIIAKKRGYIPKEKLGMALDILSQGKCKI